MRTFTMYQLALLVFVFSISGASKEKAALPKELPFKLAGIENGRGREEGSVRDPAAKPAMHRISGQVVSGSKSSLAFMTPGFIKTIVAKPGDIVKKGDLLASLDPVDYELQVSLARVNKAQAQIAEQVAKNEFEREKTLKLEGASSGSQFEQVELKYKQAQTALQLADINWKIAMRSLENSKLRAPYNCVVAMKHKDIAERVTSETPVFDIYDVNKIEVQLNAPEILIGKLEIGSKLSIKVPSINLEKEAIVTKKEPFVSKDGRTFGVTVTLKGVDPRVVPGLFAEALLN